MTVPQSIDHDERPAAVSPEGPAWVLAVEATRLASEVRGIGLYVRAILPRLLEQRPGLRIVLYVRNHDRRGSIARIFASSPSLRDRVDVRPVREMGRAEADVVWYPWNVARSRPASGAVVVTVHDVAPLAIPDPRAFKWLKNARWRRLYRATARTADVIITDSSFTADEVHRYLGVPHARMRVVLLAADDGVVPPVARDAQALARLGVTRPYMLVVGAADRRKNLGLVLRAMQRVVHAIPRATLVLAGPRSDKVVFAASATWRRTLGFVSEDDLATVYRGAEALVMPSSYEGFGLPVLEAMRLGTPVICSRASSLPEVAGDAALWFEPDDEAALADAMCRVFTDDVVRARLSAASLAQAAKFSWDDTARLTLAAFDDARRMAPRRAPTLVGS